MKTGGWIGIVVAVVILVGLGIYLSTSGSNVSKTSASDSALVNANDKSANGNRIDISGFAFSPSSLTIKAGETVYWTNKDSAPHTIVSDSGNELGSDSLEKNGEYSHTFSKKGTYTYHCGIHTTMKGTIIVQ